MSTRLKAADEGFSLVEVIVAFALFAILVTGCLVVLGSAQASTRDNSRRSTATNLAARELAITSDTFGSPLRGPAQVAINDVRNPDPLDGGRAGDPLVVDGVPYTVLRSAQWASVGSTAASTCDEGSSAELAYLRVRVRVTWPGGEDHPVELSTVLTPLKGTYSDNDGHIGLKVVDAEGAPRSGQSVTISGPSGTRTASTAGDGCVLFAFLTPGTYSVTLSTTGYVDILGHAPSVTTANVQPGQLWRSTVSYDRAATITASFTTADGYAVPTGLASAVMLGNSALLPSGAAAAVTSPTTGTPRTIPNLWPYAAGYELWAGACVDNDPMTHVEAGGAGRDLPVTVTPGGTSTGVVELGALSIVNGSGSSRTNVTAIQVPDTGCPAAGTYPTSGSNQKSYGVRVTFGTVAANTTLKTSLPFGTWQIWNGTSWKGPVTLVKGAAPGSVAL
ncbi:prepilin-type N-terminal cleavage/methylation domain-containing protein [Nocardioides mangrovi]|uniref:Prepilin-type N-terminal cleavage/methylation domain-containing protein n=1 Tax=Nocardioides mangrovi TaxID=2874580 RepID=A0ABS7UJ61_9ACTN|nr:prepilin-type N-terminal cleavage/methylation domain-containing protein [Nocardioides mangrovi]MBZ5740022.1 prepilin-type N-terminal cleavage/methylation domain-containing protein [Nocardioides mangrovi]MBZ5740807.1 prepilin-type N-terminal cleavage/methylation domain-containing protein [Nocardioides mangrovi]